MTVASTQSALDTRNMAGSIRAFVAQCTQAYDATEAIAIPEKYSEARSLVICGMGGSALGGHVLGSLYAEQLRIPFAISNQYTLPGWVDSSTLMVLSSYSGSTAETLAAAKSAIERGAMCLGLTAGEPLLGLLRSHQAPVYAIEPDHNPCGQPRMALGYALIGLFGLLWPTGLIPDSREIMPRILLDAQARIERLEPNHVDSPIPTACALLLNRVINIVAAEHLEGNAHILANQINENAKAQATWYGLPEVNHHLMEGLRHPPGIRNQTAFLFLESAHYTAPIRARIEVMKNILREMELPFATLQFNQVERLTECLVAVVAGSWVSYQLALGYGIDPSPIPYVDQFKRELKGRGF